MVHPLDNPPFSLGPWNISSSLCSMGTHNTDSSGCPLSSMDTIWLPQGMSGGQGEVGRHQDFVGHQWVPYHSVNF